jgi:hypothetical protein
MLVEVLSWQDLSDAGDVEEDLLEAVWASGAGFV